MVIVSDDNGKVKTAKGENFMERKHDELCITVEEMGRRIGVGRVGAYALASTEGFPALRIGKRILIPTDALKRWLEEQARSGNT
jgi:excisionase family DNA binding protein